jgi:hypothetical protein
MYGHCAMPLFYVNERHRSNYVYTALIEWTTHQRVRDVICTCADVSRLRGCKNHARNCTGSTGNDSVMDK